MKTSIKFTAISFCLISLQSCKKPDACINAPSDWVEVGTSIEMSSCSINADEYEWNMGDGSELTTESINHTYQNTGVYTIELTAIKGRKESKTSKAINVVGPNYKFQGTWSVNENCDGNLDYYDVTIDASGTNQIIIHNFLNAGLTVSGTVNGTSVTLNPQNGLMDQSGDYLDLVSGFGTLNGNTLSISWTVSDVNYGNWFGVMSCSATYAN